MDVESLKQRIFEQVCSEWQRRTAQIVKNNQKGKIEHSFIARNMLDGYLTAMAETALLLDDEELREDICLLIMTLIFFDSPSFHPVTTTASAHA